MTLGILKETKVEEYRVICTPNEVRSIVAHHHRVLTQAGCGEKAGFSDEAYAQAGATVVPDAQSIYRECDIVAKVKEFEPAEYGLIREGQIVIGAIHPAGNPEEVQALLESRCISFSAEDSHRFGSPNCESAGKQGALFGLESMMTIHGGKGKYVGGFAGAPRANVLILGGGLVGQNVLEVLYALGAKCTLMDIQIGLLRQLKNQYSGHIDTAFCTQETIAEVLPETDIVYNCIKWPKHRKDFLITRDMLHLMEPGSVLVDISNDNPGAIESSRPTSHDAPRYIENGVVHFCVDNIPSAVAQSTSISLATSTLPFLLSLLNHGVKQTCILDGFYRRSLTTYLGSLTHEETSALQNRPWIQPEVILGIEAETLDPAPPATKSVSKNFMTLGKEEKDAN